MDAYHVAHEFMKDRCAVIFEAKNRYDDLNKKAESFLESCLNLLRLSKEDREYKDVHNYIFKWLKENKEVNLIVETPSDDAVLNQLLILFEGKVGVSFTDEQLKEIKKEGVERYSKHIPPGYKDA